MKPLYPKALILMGAGLLLILRNGTGQQIHRLSLQQSLDYAQKHQTSIQSARIDELSTLAEENQVAGLAWPQINATGEFQDYLKLPTTLFPDFLSPAVYGILKKENLIPQNQVIQGGGQTPVQFGTQYNVNAGITLDQTLFDPSVMVALQARRSVADLAHKSLLFTERDVRVNVSKSYYGVLLAGRELRLVNDNIARLDHLLHDTRIMYRTGVAEKLDVDRLNVQLNNLVSQQTQARNLFTLSSQLLKYQMGMPIRDSLELSDTLGFSDLKGQLLTGTNFDYNNRIDYQVLEAQKKVNEYNLKRYRLANIPILSALGDYGVNAARNSFNFFDRYQPWFKTFFVSLSLKVPIFDGFQRKYQSEQAKLGVEKTQVQIEGLKEGIDLEQQQALTNLTNNLINVTTEEKNMSLAEEVYDQTVKKYEQGVGSNIEINNAEGDLQTAQLGYYNALYNAMVAKIDYLKAFGKL